MATSDSVMTTIDLRARERELSEEIGANASQLSAMLQLTYGNVEGDLFNNLNERNRDNFFWACSTKAEAIEKSFEELGAVHSKLRVCEAPNPTPPTRDPIGNIHEAAQMCWSLRAMVSGAEAILQRHQDSPSAGAATLLFAESRKWLSAVLGLLDVNVTNKPLNELGDTMAYLQHFVDALGHVIGAVSADPLYGNPGTRGEDQSMAVNLLIGARKESGDVIRLLREARVARDARA